MKSTFGLYIHFPFCLSRCHYCNFLSIPIEKSLCKKYLHYLWRELQLLAETEPFHDLEARTIYLGGGTPSIMQPEEIKNSLNLIGNYFRITEDPEITIEANPNSLSQKKIRGLRNCGINRITIGFQSLNRRELEILGRTHSPDDCRSAFKNARNAGFDNIGVDIIFGIPSQTFHTLKETLERIVEMSPEHVSAYSLTIEEGTHLQRLYKRGDLKLSEEGRINEFYNLIMQSLKDSGYEQYEISNFAKPGFECIHNKNYWNFTSYAGVGVGVHSFDGKRRSRNTGDFQTYFDFLDKNMLPVESRELLTESQLMIETLMLGLRQTQGIDLQDFTKRFGKKETDEIIKKINSVNSEKTYFIMENDIVFLTDEGKTLLDELLIMLI